MKWSKTLPRKSGWYWVRLSNDSPPPIDPKEVFHVEGRDKSNDGWVWLGGDAGRFYLTPGCRDECGNNQQSEEWMQWEWAGPIPEPSEAP